MRIFRSIILLLCTGAAAMAQAEVETTVSDTILSRLQSARPDFSYGEVKSTPLPGIYQVQVEGGPIMYTDASADHVVVGELYQVVPGQFVNLAEAERVAERRKVLAEIDRDRMIVFPAEGDTRAIINVFTDVDCGYCRKLHQEVPELNQSGVEVRYLAYPRAGIGSSSYRKLVQAWCADNPRQALTDLKAGKTIDVELCDDNPVASDFELGHQFGVSGTPSLVLMDGTMIVGYRPHKELLKLLGI